MYYYCTVVTVFRGFFRIENDLCVSLRFVLRFSMKLLYCMEAIHNLNYSTACGFFFSFSGVWFSTWCTGMGEVKQFVNEWLAKRQLQSTYEYRATGPKHRQRFVCEVFKKNSEGNDDVYSFFLLTLLASNTIFVMMPWPWIWSCVVGYISLDAFRYVYHMAS